LIGLALSRTEFVIGEFNFSRPAGSTLDLDISEDIGIVNCFPGNYLIGSSDPTLIKSHPNPSVPRK
jgi:hypothetical protein